MYIFKKCFVISVQIDIKLHRHDRHLSVVSRLRNDSCNTHKIHVFIKKSVTSVRILAIYTSKKKCAIKKKKKEKNNQPGKLATISPRLSLLVSLLSGCDLINIDGPNQPRDCCGLLREPSWFHVACSTS